MKKIIIKLNQAVQLVLMSPLKLPVKAAQIIKYVALSLGIIESVITDKDNDATIENPEDETTFK